MWPDRAAVFLQFRADQCHCFPLLAGDFLHFAVDLFLRGSDGFAVGDLVEQEGRFHVARGFILLRLADFLPVQLDAARIDALGSQCAQLVFDVDLDLSVDVDLGDGEIV